MIHLSQFLLLINEIIKKVEKDQQHHLCVNVKNNRQNT